MLKVSLLLALRASVEVTDVPASSNDVVQELQDGPLSERMLRLAGYSSVAFAILTSAKRGRACGGGGAPWISGQCGVFNAFSSATECVYMRFTVSVLC